MPVRVVVPLLGTLVTVAVPVRILTGVDGAAVAALVLLQLLVSREQACRRGDGLRTGLQERGRITNRPAGEGTDYEQQERRRLYFKMQSPHLNHPTQPHHPPTLPNHASPLAQPSPAQVSPSPAQPSPAQPSPAQHVPTFLSRT